MRVFSKLIIVALVGLCFTAALGFYWLNYDSHDLPNINVLAQFAPSQPTTTKLMCSGKQVDVVPFSAMGSNIMIALETVEAGTNKAPNANANNSNPDNSKENQAEQEKQSESTLTLQIARIMFCGEERELRRGVLEMRTAIQIQRHYSQDELKAIYLNTRSFGGDLYGLNEASQHFFHKAPADLQLPEAALLVGLIKAPNSYSPTQHPDRAIARRNEVIDEMLAAGKISAQDAAVAKNSPLLSAPAAPAQAPPAPESPAQ